MRNSKGQFIKTERIKKNCLTCDKKFGIYPYQKETTKFCSHKCWKENCKKNLLIKNCVVCEKEFKVHLSRENAKYCSYKCKAKSQLGSPGWWQGKKRLNMTGENNPTYVKDRTKLQRYNDDNKDRRSSAYNSWRNDVWKRDNWKCRISNNCKGKIKVHHILSWRNYPELRYNINNGITLCQAHHPLKRAEEKRLIPFFQGLVPVSDVKL